ncbi:protein kinase [Myxococcaceae bacterium GXIMD 01537]
MGCVYCGREHPGSEACPPPGLEAPVEGQRHGPLVVRRRLGTGSLGTVYLAEYPPTQSRFAVKVMHRHLAEHVAVRERFFTEARAAASLNHPNVARVLDVRPGPHGRPCLLMEYVDGLPLARLPLPLSAGEAVEFLGQALEGLEAAHALGLVHGDLRPRHLFLSRTREGERRVKMLDLGMASTLLAGLSREERATGMMVASAYTAPELWSGGAPDAGSDLFALAVVGYQLITGKLPFDVGPSFAPPRPPHDIDACVPRALSAVLLRALSPRPEDRYPHARALREALRSAIAEPTADEDLARLLARTAALRKDPYTLLGMTPAADFAEVHRRADGALRRLESFRGRALPVAQHRELEALRSSVEAARRVLGSPAARVGFDAVRGNVAGIARCLAAGLSEEQVEPLRHAFLAARPGFEARARALFAEAHALEARRAVGPALERYAQALALDPLNIAWQQHYQALSRQARELAVCAGQANV